MRLFEDYGVFLKIIFADSACDLYWKVAFSRVSRIVPKQPYQNLRGFGVFLEVVAVEVLFSRELWGFLGGLFPALRLRG